MFLSIRYCCFILTIILLNSVAILAQNEALVSELKKDLQTARQFIESDPNQSLKLVKKVEEQALKLNNSDLMAQTYTVLGNVYGLKQDRSDRAAEYHRKAFQLYHTQFKQKQISGSVLYAFFSENITPIYELISSEKYNRRRRDKLAIRKYQELYTELSRFFLQEDVRKTLQNSPTITKQVIVNFTQADNPSARTYPKVETFKVLHHKQKELYEAYIQQLEGVLQKSKIDFKAINQDFAEKKIGLEAQLDTFQLMIVGKDSILTQNNLINRQKLNLEKAKSQVREANYKSQLADYQRNITIVTSAIGFLLLLILGGYWSYRRVQKRKKLIAEQNEVLRKVNFELDQFSYRVSHDIRAPISSTLGLVNLAKEEKDLSQMQQYHQLMEKSLNRLDQFIRDVLTHSKSSRGASQIEVIDLPTFIQELINPYQYDPELTDVKINFEFDGGGNQEFYSDKYLLEVILSNLIGNGLRYRDKHKPEANVHIQVQNTPQTLHLRIEDNGVGIAEEHLNRVFEMFYRANTTTQGSGLGLYMVKQNVEKLAGKIHIESKLGEGTRFELEIPNLKPIKNASSITRQMHFAQSPQIFKFVS
jgi:signal transduction histidine kinase